MPRSPWASPPGTPPRFNSERSSWVRAFFAGWAPEVPCAAFQTGRSSGPSRPVFSFRSRSLAVTSNQVGCRVAGAFIISPLDSCLAVTALAEFCSVRRQPAPHCWMDTVASRLLCHASSLPLLPRRKMGSSSTKACASRAAQAVSIRVQGCTAAQHSVAASKLAGMSPLGTCGSAKLFQVF